MPIKKSVLSFILSVILLYGIIFNISYSQEQDEYIDATLIYIHGVMNSDFMASFNNANEMFKELQGHHIGPYRVTNFKIAYWGNLARNNDAFKLYKDGLSLINYKHNKEHSVANALNPVNILAKPFVSPDKNLEVDKKLYVDKGIALYNKGSDQSAITLRYFANDFAYDLIWLLSKVDTPGSIIDGVVYEKNDIGNNIEAVYNVIEDQINQTDGYYIIVGDSAGCIAAVKFVMDRLTENTEYNRIVKKSHSQIIYKTSRQSYEDKFAGLITIASPVNAFLSSDLERSYKLYSLLETRKDSFLNLFINEKNPLNNQPRFWINIAHRNDPVATDLSTQITSLNGVGFIDSVVTRATFVEKVLTKFDILKISESNVLKAHRWYLKNWPRLIKIMNECFEARELLEVQEKITSLDPIKPE